MCEITLQHIRAQKVLVSLHLHNVLQQTHETVDRPVARNPPPNLQPSLGSLLV